LPASLHYQYVLEISLPGNNTYSCNSTFLQNNILLSYPRAVMCGVVLGNGWGGDHCELLWCVCVCVCGVNILWMCRVGLGIVLWNGWVYVSHYLLVCVHLCKQCDVLMLMKKII
jgi:hypothetical protein